MKYLFHPEAQTEFGLAVDYYEERRTGLGLQLAAEVHATVERIIAQPTMWPMLTVDVRRCLVRRFPYGVLYAYNEHAGEVLILAVMHLHREPGYWANRN